MTEKPEWLSHEVKSQGKEARIVLARKNALAYINIGVVGVGLSLACLFLKDFSLTQRDPLSAIAVGALAGGVGCLVLGIVLAIFPTMFGFLRTDQSIIRQARREFGKTLDYRSSAERIAELNGLLAQGLISEAEFQQKKRAILDAL